MSAFCGFSILFALIHATFSPFKVLNTCPGNDLVPPMHSNTIPEVGLNTVELIEFNGYPVERHPNIITPDGYILEMQRIPSGKSNAGQSGKPPVLVMGALLSDSASWVNMGSDNSLGFLLADAGYDVWLGNYRGTTWSRKHVSLNPDRDPKFWEYSWHQIGFYDVPTKIDYILAITGAQSLYYIGHSQGGTLFYVMASSRPEYNQKIRFAGTLAPAVFMSNSRSPPGVIGAHFQHEIQLLSKILGWNEVLPKCRIMQHVLNIFCNERSPTASLCADILIHSIVGYDPEQFDKAKLMTIYSNFPVGSSMNQLMHYFQLYKSGRFCQFDYQVLKNLQVYGQLQPPDYNLAAITTPVGLYYGENDLLVSHIDSEILATKLSSLVVQYLVPYDKFNHIDFVFAKDVRALLYNKLMADMQLY